MTPLSQPLDVVIGSSRCGVVAALFMHALALSVAVILAMDRPVFAGVAVMIAISAGFVSRPSSIKHLQVMTDGSCRVWTNHGSPEIGVVRDASVFGAVAVGMTLSLGDPCTRVRRLLIIGDSVDPVAFRRLRVRLRLLATPETASLDLWGNRN